MEEKVLGLVAGSGDLPPLVAQGARALGYKVATVGVKGETPPELQALSDRYTEVRLGQLGGALKALKDARSTACVMVGGFSKKLLFSQIRPDLTALKLAIKLGGQFQDDRLLRALAELVEQEGIPVLGVPPFIPDHMALDGVMTKRKPTRDEEQDIAFGMQVARTTGALDVGQTVVVRRGTVLAVEAVEGTDQAIRRGAELGRHGHAGGRGGVVVCKVVKPHQDVRLDLPAVGPQTMEVCASVGVTVVAVEAQRTIMVDRPKTLRAAEERKIAVVGVAPPASTAA